MLCPLSYLYDQTTQVLFCWAGWICLILRVAAHKWLYWEALFTSAGHYCMLPKSGQTKLWLCTLVCVYWISSDLSDVILWSLLLNWLRWTVLIVKSLDLVRNLQTYCAQVFCAQPFCTQISVLVLGFPVQPWK